MDSFLAGHLKDLALRAYNQNFVTCSNFLSFSDIRSFYDDILKVPFNELSGNYLGAKFKIFGGHQDFERGLIYFFPDFTIPDEYLDMEIDSGNFLTCIKATPLNAKFTDVLTHRDFLGALMNLGIERDNIGDILIDSKKHTAFIFVLSSIADTIISDLIRIKHTSVSCKIVPCTNCYIVPEFIEKKGSVSSLRLDCILSFVYPLSREKAKDLIAAEHVFVDGKKILLSSTIVKDGSVISARGFGKFKFISCIGKSKKDKYVILVNIYK